MSNFLAIATVTATLSQLIQASIDVDVSGSRVTTVRPDIAGSTATESKVNIFLYQVTTNPSLRNVDLPTRRANGDVIQKPKIALDLHYLITFYGEELDLIPQRLMGSVVRTLHSIPVLTRQTILDTINSSNFSYLAASDLADDVEQVKFTPLPLSLEELSKLWSVLLQTNYALSISYQGTVVLIEGEETPRPVLPVRDPRFSLAPFRFPVLEQLLSQNSPTQLPQRFQPIVVGSTLVLLGKQLKAGTSAVTFVRMAGSEIQLDAQTITNTRINFQLPATTLAGVQGIQVLHKRLLEPANELVSGEESNVLPFVLHPKILSINTNNVRAVDSGLFAADVILQVSPLVGRQQSVVLLLNELQSTPGTVPPVAYSFTAPPRGADSDTITIAITDVKAANYLVRLQVGGAENVPDPDSQKNTLQIS